MSTNDLLKNLSSHIDAGMLQQIGNTIGASPIQTQAAVGAALPMLLGGLARNTSTPNGSASLAAAVDKNHDGTLLSGLGALLGGSSQSGGSDLLSMAASMLGAAPGPTSAKSVDGAGILGHIFGGGQSGVSSGVAKAGGIDKGQALQLLMVLAPIVMSAIGKSKRENNLDACGLAGMVQGASQQTGGGTTGGIFGAMLDANHDGNIADDLMKAAGKNLLGSLFG